MSEHSDKTPYFFNLYTEHITQKTGLDSEKGVKSGGRNIVT